MSTISKKFVLKHTFKNVSSVIEKKSVFSEEEEHFNVPWRIYIARKDGSLSFYLNCPKSFKIGNWSVKTQIQLRIVSGYSRFLSAENTFGNTNPQKLFTSYGWAEFMNWETMTAECIINDTLEVEAHVLIEKMTGFYEENLIHFNDQELSDVMMLIGETKFYLSKQFLAAQSSYFKSLFMEKHKKTSKLGLPFIDSDDFQKLLELFHGHPVINENNVEGIVLLAKLIDSPLAKQQCEKFLVEKSKKSLKKKMQMAEKYKLKKLASFCEESLNVPVENVPVMQPKLDNVESDIPNNAQTANSPPPLAKFINEVMEYKSSSALIDTSSTVLDESSNEGLKCIWNGYMIYQKGPISLTWNFDWKVLKSQGIDGLSGDIQLKSVDNSFAPFLIPVDLTEPNQMIEHVIGNAANDMRVSFEYHFIPLYSSYVAETTVIIEESNPELEIFLPSKKNDTILVVDAKLLYVNKSFLSYHSDYFEELFSSDVNEESENQNQYSIDGVKYEDFELLIRAIHLNTGFPDENRIPRLLEMASRFKVSSVIGQVEHHLLNNSKLDNITMIWISDKYRMQRLLDKSITQMDSKKKAIDVKSSPEYSELSSDTKGRLFERLVLLL